MKIRILLISLIVGVTAYYFSLVAQSKKIDSEVLGGSNKDVLKKLNESWKNRYFLAMTEYLGLQKHKRIVVTNQQEIDDAKDDFKKNQDTIIPEKRFGFILQDRHKNDGSKAWMNEILNLAVERHSVDFGDYETVKRGYNIEMLKTIEQSYIENPEAKTPYLTKKKVSDESENWMYNAILTLALDLGLDHRKEEVQKLLLKMG